eukprot:1159778-Pelagomonas_calceolata.AAC.1
MDGTIIPLVATGQEDETVHSLVKGLICLTSNHIQLEQRLLELHALPRQAQLERVDWPDQAPQQPESLATSPSPRYWTAQLLNPCVQELREGVRGSSSVKAANSELRLELLRWRKKVSIYRLKLASVEEDLRLHLDNANSLSQQLQSVLESNQDYEARLGALAHELGLSEASSSAHKEIAHRLQVRGAAPTACPSHQLFPPTVQSGGADSCQRSSAGHSAAGLPTGATPGRAAGPAQQLAATVGGSASRCAGCQQARPGAGSQPGLYTG